MSVDIVSGASQKPVASDKLAGLISSFRDLSGRLFIGYPFINTPEGSRTIDALLLSAEKGIIVFDLIEGTHIEGYESRQYDYANKLESLLKNHSELTRRRHLRPPIHTISFGPAIGVAGACGNGDCILANSETIEEKINNFADWGDEEDKADSIYEKTLSVLENVSTIRKSRAMRSISREDSRGDKLDSLEKSIATLDSSQSRAVIETVKGVQRIRGLAGSGKTIVLALKAAYLHSQHPEWRIAVTFNTRSLKGHFQRLIAEFLISQTREEPDWNNLRVVNAWGAPGGADRDGIYHEFCTMHDIGYFDFRQAKAKFGQGKEFSGACENAINQVKEKEKAYDVILVDEAQDLPIAFLRICYGLLDNNKRLVYAYDELQNLSGESLPSPREIFGKDAEKNSLFWPEKQWASDVILKKCYRNSRPVLVTAHALGFGIYRKPQHEQELGLIQMFDQPQLWEEIGYEVKNGSLKDGHPVTLHRNRDTSPGFLEDHSMPKDLIQFVCFKEERQQTEWLVKKIKENLQHDELRHDDIVVINPDPLTTRGNVGPIRSRLLEEGINSHLAGIDTNPDIFFKSEASVTFTGIHRAKGNEAGMVYIVNAHDCYSAGLNLSRIRNRLFTSITRSKAWVRVLGVGSRMEELRKEFDQLVKNNFELNFTYPTKTQRADLRIVHRDAAEEDIKRIRRSQESLSELVDDLQSGKMNPSDLDKTTLSKLKELLPMD